MKASHFPRVIRIGSRTLTEIRLQDMQMYNSYIRNTECPANLWSANFAYMWAISQSKNRTVFWTIIDGLLVSFALSYKNSLYLTCLPLGSASPEHLNDVVLTSLKICLKWNRGDKSKSFVKMVNDDQLNFIEKCQSFSSHFTRTTWVGIERHFDVEMLTFLRGKELENVRNRVNKFQRENSDANIRFYRDDDYNSIVKLEKHWKKTSGKKYSKVFDGVYFKELVKYGKELEQITIVVEKGDGSIIGMISGGILPTGQSWGSVEKFISGIPGLSETLIVEYAKLMHQTDPKIKFMNVGSDLGPGGLREYKLKFRPALNFKRYRIGLK